MKGKEGRRTQKCTLYQKKHIDRYRFPPCGFHRPEICPRLQKRGFGVKLNNFKFIYSERREPLPEMTCHQYSGWEHVLSQTALHRLLVPAQSPSAAAEWRRRRGWRGQQRKHLYPNWWSFMTALFVKVRTEWLYYTLLVTFFGCPQHNDTSSCPCQVHRRRKHFIMLIASVQSDVGTKQQVRVNQKTWMLLNRTWRHWAMVPRLVFPAIWLSRNEACWRAFVIMSTKSGEKKRRDDFPGYKEAKTRRPHRLTNAKETLETEARRLRFSFKH